MSVADVLSFIDSSDVAGLARELVEIESHSGIKGGEHRVASKIGELLIDHGIKPRIDDLRFGANLIASLGSGSPVLVFNGHLDTVPPTEGWKENPFVPKVKRGKLIGLGACDMKGAIATMIVAGMEAISESDEVGVGLLFTSDELPFSWDVTSDTISAYIAKLLKIEKLILVKDVDGIFARDPKKYPETFMLKEITPKELLNIETCIDAFLPKFLLLEKGLTCYVVNGLYPERIKQILEGEKPLATIIKA